MAHCKTSAATSARDGHTDQPTCIADVAKGLREASSVCRSTLGDQRYHTLRLEPVLRVARRIINTPGEAFVSVDVAAGGAAFVIVSVTRSEEGYRAARIGN